MRKVYFVTTLFSLFLLLSSCSVDDNVKPEENVINDDFIAEKVMFSKQNIIPEIITYVTPKENFEIHENSNFNDDNKNIEILVDKNNNPIFINNKLESKILSSESTILSLITFSPLFNDLEEAEKKKIIDDIKLDEDFKLLKEIIDNQEKINLFDSKLVNDVLNKRKEIFLKSKYSNRISKTSQKNESKQKLLPYTFEYSADSKSVRFKNVATFTIHFNWFEFQDKVGSYILSPGESTDFISLSKNNVPHKASFNYLASEAGRKDYEKLQNVVVSYWIDIVAGALAIESIECINSIRGSILSKLDYDILLKESEGNLLIAAKKAFFVVRNSLWDIISTTDSCSNLIKEGAFKKFIAAIGAILNVYDLFSEFGDVLNYLAFDTISEECFVLTNGFINQCSDNDFLINITDELNFKKVNIGETKGLNFVIENFGNQQVILNKIQFNDAVFDSHLTFPIVIGRTKSLTILFSPVADKKYKSIAKLMFDNGRERTINLTGEGEQQVTSESRIVLKSEFSFNNVNIGYKKTGTLTILNTGNKKFEVQNIIFPNNVFSADWYSGTINTNGSRNVIVTFQPTNEKTYSGIINVQNNADSGNNKISIIGNGIDNNTGQPNIILTSQFEIDDDTSGGSDGNGNGIPEAGEEIELSVQLQNTGNASATNVTAVLSTNDSDISITDPNETYGTITAGSTDWNTDFDFDIDANCPTKTVNFTLDITSDQGSWQHNFSLNIQGTSGSNPQVDIGNNTPRDNCSDTGSSNNYKLDLNTVYYKQNWNIDNIIGYGSDGNRGMWYRFETTNSGLYNIGVSFNGNAGFQLFSSCTSSSPIITSNSSSGNAETAQVNLNGNTEYFIRFYDINDNNPVNFVITIEND